MSFKNYSQIIIKYNKLLKKYGKNKNQNKGGREKSRFIRNCTSTIVQKGRKKFIAIRSVDLDCDKDVHARRIHHLNESDGQLRK